jgi:DNA-binding MarR family transcriptional regulator
MIIRERAHGTRNYVSKLTIAALFSWIVLSLLFCSTAMAQETDIIIEIDQGPQTADLTVDPGLTIPISGNITITSGYALRVTVYFGIYAPDGWITTISPEQATVSYGENPPISFTGEVTPSTASEQKDHEVYVWASIEDNNPSDIEITEHSSSSVFSENSVIGLIKNRINMIHDATEHRVLPDSTVSYFFTVTNVATVEDTFYVILLGDRALEEQGWLVSASADSLTLAPGEEDTFYVEQVIPEGAPEGDYEIDVFVSSNEHGDSEATRTIATRVRVPEISKPFDWTLILMVGFVASGVGIAAFFAATEVGYLSFLSLFLPLYVRLKKKDVLSHFTRGQIFGYIQANPGAHYNAIMQDLDLKNGVGAYHLKVLEREGYIKSLKEGIYKRFYPATMRVPEKRLHLSRIQRDILKEIQNHPGVTQKQLSKLLDESKQVINYHVKILESARLVRYERAGRETNLFAGKVKYVENGDIYEVVEEAGPAEPVNI